MKALKCSTSVKRVNVCARPRSDKRGRWWWWSTCRTDGCTGEGTIRSDRQADTATVRPSERQRRSAARRAVQSSFSKADQEREREAGASQGPPLPLRARTHSARPSSSSTYYFSVGRRHRHCRRCLRRQNLRSESTVDLTLWRPFIAAPPPPPPPPLPRPVGPSHNTRQK